MVALRTLCQSKTCRAGRLGFQGHEVSYRATRVASSGKIPKLCQCRGPVHILQLKSLFSECQSSIGRHINHLQQLLIQLLIELQFAGQKC